MECPLRKKIIPVNRITSPETYNFQGPLFEDQCSTIHENPSLLWQWDVYWVYVLNKIQELDTIQNQVHPPHTHIKYFSEIHFSLPFSFMLVWSKWFHSLRCSGWNFLLIFKFLPSNSRQNQKISILKFRYRKSFFDALKAARRNLEECFWMCTKTQPCLLLHLALLPPSTASPRLIELFRATVSYTSLSDECVDTFICPCPFILALPRL